MTIKMEMKTERGKELLRCRMNGDRTNNTDAILCYEKHIFFVCLTIKIK